MNFDALILNHFKTYHAFMAVLFGTINALAATAIFGSFTVGGVFSVGVADALGHPNPGRYLVGYPVPGFQVEA